MVTVQIEREGYMVEAVVGAIDTGPGIAPGLEIRQCPISWVSDPAAYAAKYGSETPLWEVTATEVGEIEDELIDAAELAIAAGGEEPVE